MYFAHVNITGEWAFFILLATRKIVASYLIYLIFSIIMKG